MNYLLSRPDFSLKINNFYKLVGAALMKAQHAERAVGAKSPTGIHPSHPKTLLKCYRHYQEQSHLKLICGKRIAFSGNNSTSFLTDDGITCLPLTPIPVDVCSKKKGCCVPIKNTGLFSICRIGPRLPLKIAKRT